MDPDNKARSVRVNGEIGCLERNHAAGRSMARVDQRGDFLHKKDALYYSSPSTKFTQPNVATNPTSYVHQRFYSSDKPSFRVRYKCTCPQYTCRFSLGRCTMRCRRQGRTAALCRRRPNRFVRQDNSHHCSTWMNRHTSSRSSDNPRCNSRRKSPAPCTWANHFEPRRKPNTLAR